MAGFVVVMVVNVLLLGSAIYLMFFADPDSPGMGGRSYRLVCEGGPRMFSAGLRRVFGEACAGRAAAFGDWALNKPNRLMQGFYMVIVNLSFICFIIEGLPRIPNEVLPWPYHDASVYVVMAACIASFVAACNTSPGVVRVVKAKARDTNREVSRGRGVPGGTGSSPQEKGRAAAEEARGQQQQQQQQKLSGESEPRGVGWAGRRGEGEGGGRHTGLYPHDGVVFVKGFCKTCRVVKPARSKHCRVCNVCVPRFDHHCAWLNQCVGEENYRHFLLFLLIHSSMLWYGTVLTYGILKSIVIKRKLMSARFYRKNSKSYVRGSYGVVAQYLLFHYGKLCGLLALAATMAVVLTGFLAYHVYLLLKGTTTNESAKWAEARDFHRRLTKAWENGSLVPPPVALVPAAPDDAGATGASATTSEATAAAATDVAGGAGEGDGEKGYVQVDGDTGGPPPASSVGASSAGEGGADADGSSSTGLRRRGGRKGSGGQAPAGEPAGAGAGAAEAEPKGAGTEPAVEVPHPGPLPDNIYDNGLWANLMEVLFPRSLRKEGKGKVLPYRDPFRHCYKPYWVPAS
eukprot:g16024.t1